MDADKYYQICEAMGVEPVKEDTPIDFADFPSEIQLAFEIYNLLPARIAEFSGVYLGRDYGNLGYLFNMYEITEISWQRFYFRTLLIIDSIQIEINDNKRKAKEALSKNKPGTISHG